MKIQTHSPGLLNWYALQQEPGARTCSQCGVDPSAVQVELIDETWLDLARWQSHCPTCHALVWFPLRPTQEERR